MMPLADLLARRIADAGPITFAQFSCRSAFTILNLATIRAPIRAGSGDYYTSVDVHPIFGRLLARQLAEMWEIWDRRGLLWPWQAGSRVQDILPGIFWILPHVNCPPFMRRANTLRWSVPTRGAPGDAQRLASHIAAGKFTSAAEMPASIPTGCIFSNELIDALPVHRVAMDAGKLREVCIGFEGGKFTEILGDPSTPGLAQYFREQGITLQEEHQAEVCLDACLWISTAGQAIDHGFVLTIGITATKGAASMMNRTKSRDAAGLSGIMLRRKRFSTRPAEQDLTAHANFTALDIWGRRAGLERTGLVTQSQFLVALGRAN